MKILHTADWHLGKRLERFDRRDEQRAVLDEICAIAEAEDVDAVLIAGDLYDTYNPPTEAIEMFYKAVKRLAHNGRRAVIAIAGNHDSPDRIEAPDPLARECGILLSGYPNSEIRPFKLDSGLEITVSAPGFVELKLPRIPYPLRLLLTPYANEVRLKRDLGVDDPEAAMREALENHWAATAEKYCDNKGVNLLATHLFMMKKGAPPPEEPEDERPINVGGAQAVYTENLPKQVQYVALGHLHRFQTMGKTPCPVVYSGSPLEYSFAEADQDKHVVIVEAEPGKKVAYRAVQLSGGRRLARKTFENMDKAVRWLLENPDLIVELSIRSDSYLTAEDRKRLAQAHERFIGPIPILSEEAMAGAAPVRKIDLGKSMEALFVDYFKFKNEQDPNDSLLELFREIVGTEVEE